MQQISTFIHTPAPPKVETARSFRENLINQFIEKILIERTGTEYEPKTEREIKRFKAGVAIKINQNPFLKQSWQLEGFYKYCVEAKSFGARFYSSLSTKEK